ncbi:MAG: hypothetical protein QOK43_2139 [Acidimicrobiaceae bacterium]|nr:hypothetical protein [Acidimicrobiaceae bacterium]
MAPPPSQTFRAARKGFVHEALFYGDDAAFLAGTVPFLQVGIDNDEPALVALPQRKIDMLRAALGEGGRAIRYVDMEKVGHNPARIIPAWHQFVEDHKDVDRPMRGIGEPAWPGRSFDEFVECERHEALLNLAFADAGDFELLCPYDVNGLDPAVVEGAHRTHPVVVVNGRRAESGDYMGLDEVVAPFSRPLADPPAEALRLDFGPDALIAVRQFIRDAAARAGMGTMREGELVLAVNELATNALRYGGGRGAVETWSDGKTVICQVTDGGLISDPLIGRLPPPHDSERGRGLWLVNQLCDLVQVRTGDGGSVVRVRLAVA